MLNILLAVIFSALNAIRGSGAIDRISCALGMAIGVFTLAVIHEGAFEVNVINFSITFLGMWAGLACGWGNTSISYLAI